MTTTGTKPRRGVGGALQATLVGGVLFLVPFVVLLFILEKALRLAAAILGPLQNVLPFQSLLGLPAPTVAAVALLVVVCMLAGLFARTSVARRMVDWLESHVLSNVPGYTFMKSVGASMVGVESAQFNEVVSVRLDDAWLVGFLVDRISESRVVVFIPDAPATSSGGIQVVTEDRIQVLDVPVPQARKWFRSLGLGSREVLDKPRVAS